MRKCQTACLLLICAGAFLGCPDRKPKPEPPQSQAFETIESGMEQVRKQFGEGMTEQGIQTLETLIDRFPEHRKILTQQLLNIYIKLQRLEDAEKCIDRYLEAFPDDETFLVYRGQILLAKGHQEQAKGLFEQILQRHPGSIQAQEALAGLAMASGQLIEAASRFQRIIASAPDAIGVLQQLLQVQLQLDRKDAALKTARSIRDILSHEMQAHRQYQDLALEAGLRSQLLAEYRQIADEQPDSAVAQYLFGRIIEDPVAAMIAFETAVRLDPDFFWGQYALGIQAFSGRDYAKARNAMEIAAQSHSPEADRGQLYLMLIDMAENKYDAAFEQARSQLEDRPHDFRIYTVIHQMLIEQEKYEEAVEYADQLHSIPGPGAALGHIQKVEIALRQQDWDTFQHLIEQSQKADVLSVVEQRELAFLILQARLTGQHAVSDEISSAFDFETLFKDHPEPLLWLGITMWELGKRDAAKEVWESAYRLLPRFISDVEVFCAHAAGLLVGRVPLQTFNESADHVRYNLDNDAWAVRGIYHMMNDQIGQAVTAFRKGNEVSRGAEFPARWLKRKVDLAE